MIDEATPSPDLPAALVEDVLGKARDLGGNLLRNLSDTHKRRDELRKRLIDKGLLLRDSELPSIVSPTTCAADGSYAVERLMTVDLAVAAAVAVEGLTPPSEARHWPEPRYQSLVFYERHSEDTATILRAAMMGEELILARAAPHELVLVDGSLTSPIIYFNQGFAKIQENAKMEVSKILATKSTCMLEAYADILESRRSDKQYAGIPKYSTKREIAHFLELDTPYDDRGLLTLIMNPGEYTDPNQIQLGQPSQPWHLGVETLRERDAAHIHVNRIVSALGTLRIFYYKPRAWLPALRVEIAQGVAENRHRMAVVLEGLKLQSVVASMLEPYPSTVYGGPICQGAIGFRPRFSTHHHSAHRGRLRRRCWGCFFRHAWLQE